MKKYFSVLVFIVLCSVGHAGYLQYSFQNSSQAHTRVSGIANMHTYGSFTVDVRTSPGNTNSEAKLYYYNRLVGFTESCNGYHPQPLTYSTPG